MKKWLIMMTWVLKSSLLALIWTPQQSGTTSPLNDVDFVNANVGWAVGGVTDNSPTDAVILRTIDKGNTWINKTPSGLNLDEVISVSAIDSLLCYVTASDLSGNRIILKTQNGGNTWNVLSAPSGIYYRPIYFINANIGWAGGLSASGGSTKVARTTNGGNSWSTGIFGCDGGPTRIFFCTSQKGFIAGGTEYNPDTGFGYIMVTNDGGNTWWESLYEGGIENTYTVIWGIHFIDTLHGWACARRYSLQSYLRACFVYSTIDGGQNWDVIFYASGNNSWILRDIYFINESEGWVVGANGRILHRVSGEWIYDTTNTTATLYSLDFVISGDTAYGWAVGSSGTILHCRVPMGVKIIEKEKELIKSYILFPITKDRSLSALPKKEIYSINGRKVEIMNKRTLPKGIYFLNSQKEGKEIAKFKLIKF